jgi:hypothetical protein
VTSPQDRDAALSLGKVAVEAFIEELMKVNHCSIRNAMPEPRLQLTNHLSSGLERHCTERLIVKLSIGCDILPASLVIDSGHCTDLRMVAIGGFGKIYRAKLRNEEVSMKVATVGGHPGTPSDNLKIRRVLLVTLF